MAKMQVINVNKFGEVIDITKAKIPKDCAVYDVIRSLDRKNLEKAKAKR